MKVYVLTAFGQMIDTMCEVFLERSDAVECMEGMIGVWETVYDCFTKEKIDGKTAWKTNDSEHRTVVWEIHERKIDMENKQ